MAKKTHPAPDQVAEAVDRVLADERVVWFPVKHFSPVCAVHLRDLIRALRPVAVLVEAPDDATPLIEHIVDPRTQPPLTVFSVYVDKRNRFGANGRLSPDEEVPVRYRGWWPLTEWAPEYVALVEGAAVGADLRFIDLSLTGRIPLDHARTGKVTEVVDDDDLAVSRFFRALCAKERRRSFPELWEARFEVGGLPTEREQFRRALLTFAWCARHSGTSPGGAGRFEADGTLVREAHMRWHVDKALKDHRAAQAEGAGPVVVVTGAFHSVALPFIKGKKAKAPKDANLQTLLTPHSFRALADLYDLQRLPGYQAAVWEAMEAEERAPFDAAAMRLLVEVMRAAREGKEAVSTADAVGAWRAAQNLARLRGNAEVTLYDLLDAGQMGFVKGDRRLFAGPVERATRSVLVGHRAGRISEDAGQVPLLADYYAQARSHRLDVSGAEKSIRLDLHKQKKHRPKSAFLHRCDFLHIPMFGELEGRLSAGGAAHFRGPDLARGADLHLITETWRVRWRETVDDRLVALADRGPTVEQAATTLLEEQLAAVKGDAAAATRLLLRCAQMMLLEQFDATLTVVEQAIEADAQLLHLVDALGDFVLLHAHQETLATQGHARLLRTVQGLFEKATLVLPVLAHADPAQVSDLLDRLQALVRVALSFETAPLDQDLLVEKVEQMVDDPEGTPAIRGAGFGVLYAFGAVRAQHIAVELESYLRGAPERVLEGGRFLDGLFLSARSVFVRSPRLLRTVNAVLGELPWETFKTLLPDLRRAFTRFIPTEIDGIARRVGEEIGLLSRMDRDAPIPEGVPQVVAPLDAHVRETLEGWW